jgi:hypothetical protein
VRRNYETLRHADVYPPCYTILPDLSPTLVCDWLTALQVERLEQRTQIVRDRLTRLNNHWEDTFFITLARNFGFGINGDAFEAWATTLSLRAVDKHRDDPVAVEAIFFGQAGLLDEDLRGDSYYDALRDEYRYLRRKFDLKQIETSRWRFLRTRPDNFPHVRIAQLADLYHRESSLFLRIMEVADIEAIATLLDVRTSPYWDNHFVYGKTGGGREKTLSASTHRLILINTVTPLLYAYGLYRADDTLRERALHILETLPAERNHIIRKWEAVGIRAATAADSQALIQLQRVYCDCRKCLHCRFGYAYLCRK